MAATSRTAFSGARRTAGTLVLGGALLGALGGPAQAEQTQSFRLEGRSLFVGNLIGEITIEGHDGSGFEVEVAVRGKDSDRIRPEIVALANVLRSSGSSIWP